MRLLVRNGFLGQLRLGNAPGAADYFPEMTAPTGDFGKNLQIDTTTPFQDQITEKKPNDVTSPLAECVFIGIVAPEIIDSKTNSIAKAAQAQGWIIRYTKRGFETVVWACKAPEPTPCPPNAKCMQPVLHDNPMQVVPPAQPVLPAVPTIQAQIVESSNSNLLPVAGAAAVVAVLALALSRS